MPSRRSITCGPCTGTTIRPGSSIGSWGARAYAIPNTASLSNGCCAKPLRDVRSGDSVPSVRGCRAHLPLLRFPRDLQTLTRACRSDFLRVVFSEGQLHFQSALVRRSLFAAGGRVHNSAPESPLRRSLGYCAPEEVYMKVYNHVRKISLQPVNTGHRASHILIRFIDGRCERISDDMRDRLGEPLLREGRSVRSGFFAGCL